MKTTLLLNIFISLTSLSMAQSPVLRNVKIEFEKKVNNQGFEGMMQMGGNMPQYSSSYFSYESDGNQSIYKAIPSPEKNNNTRFFRMQQDEQDEVYTNFGTRQQVSLKNVFEKTYLLTDSIGDIPWKLTNEFREIAGFNCRRATAVIMDSVFIVAFYTDEILGNGGPSSIAGLPGTILGLVVNRLHTTWYATRVNVTDVDVSRIAPPAAPKAEKSNKSKLIESLKGRFEGGRGMGSFGDRMIWGIRI